MDKQDLEIIVTPFGVDLTLFEPNNYSQRKSSEEIVIGNIKALEPQYGIDKLLYAIDILNKKLSKDTNWNKNLVVKIYGSGSQKSYLEELAKKKGIGDIVKFEGRISNMDVPKALSDFDIFCAMSQRESFGVAVVEAMAMEVPVVVSDVDGFREVVKNKETGIIINRDDVYAMAGALEELVRDEVKRISYGKAGRKRVQALYDWNKNVDLMEKIYNKLIKTG